MLAEEFGDDGSFSDKNNLNDNSLTQTKETSLKSDAISSDTGTLTLAQTHESNEQNPYAYKILDLNSDKDGASPKK
jgi:hypothetical protein